MVSFGRVRRGGLDEGEEREGGTEGGTEGGREGGQRHTCRLTSLGFM